MNKKSNHAGIIVLAVAAVVCVIIAVGAVVFLVFEFGKDEEREERRPREERVEVTEEKEDLPEGTEETEVTEEKEENGAEMPEADLQAVFDAYQAYIDEHVSDRESYNGCALLYLNDDKIPECYFSELSNGASFLSYKNGEILAVQGPTGYSAGSWQEENNRIRFQSLAGSNSYYEFYELAEGGDEYTKVGRTAHNEMDGDVYYIGLDERVGTLLDYQKYLALMGPFLDPVLSDTVEEAYEALKVPLIKDGTGEYEYVEDINDISREDYALCLEPEDYTYGGMGYAAEDFSYYYPKQLFEYAAYNSEATESKYGTNISTTTYYGPQGSQFKFSLTLRTDDGTIKEATDFIYKGEMSSLQEPSEIKHVTENDYGRVIVTGYNTPRDKLVYDLVKIDKDYVMQMMIAFPVYTSEEDELQKGYVTECMYRMCGFSGSSQPPRSYEEYREAVR